MKLHSVVLALFGAAIFANASPQTAAAPVEVIKIGADVVQIDASVTDATGRPVTDLRREDFTVEVDGRKQPIWQAAFSAMRGEPNVVAFVIDDLNMSYASMYATKRHLERFAKEWGADTTVALLSTGAESQPFSLHRSSDRFIRAVGDLQYNLRSSAERAAVATPQDTNQHSKQANIKRPAFAVNISPYGADQPFSGAQTLRAVDEEAAGHWQLDWENALIRRRRVLNLENIEQRVSGLVSAIDALRSIPGRKALVFVSEGFYLDHREHDQPGMGSPFFSLFDDGTVGAALRMITEVANRASVVLDTVDPRALPVNLADAVDNADEQARALLRERWQARADSRGAFQQIAADTGGLSMIEAKDMRGGFGDVLRDQCAYYVIGFEPPPKAFARVAGRPVFHTIKLIANRQGVRVRTRAGFYGVTDQEVVERVPAAMRAGF